MNLANRQLAVLFSIHGNLPEWRACFAPMSDAPRLPLPFAFAALARQGLTLGAYDTDDKPRPDDIAPFQSYFAVNDFASAYRSCDFILLWGTRGLRSCLSEVATPHRRRKTVLLAYGWRPMLPLAATRRGMLTLTRLSARFARCVVLMTHRQVAAARADLPAKAPIVQLRVGIDTGYYARPSTEEDVPEAHRATVEKLLREPYAILPGDELRLNDDALQAVQETGLRLVRISQYGYKSGTASLKDEVARRRLGDRVIVFERISYAFLRFLLQHAAAYAGFVDASWQPAGWTAACESLASGLPLVTYDGLTAQEFVDQGISQELIRIVPAGDRTGFGRELITLASAPRPSSQTLAAQGFAAKALDIEATAPEFARNLISALSDDS